MQRIESIYYKTTDDKGRGVFTDKPLRRGAIIELCPVVVIPPHEIETIDKTVIYNYYFLWQNNQAAIALGYGSLYNHSYDPNAEYIMDYEGQILVIRALRNISPHEEITFNYNGDPDDRDKVWFEPK